MRLVVVGAGILGLAAARQALLARPDLDVVVLDKEDAVARHQTGHNSGVVHAGIYYAPGSLKARLCRRGLALLRGYCAERGIPYEECGKVVVATDPDELPRLDELERRGTANGVAGLRRLDAGGLREIEPHARGIAALHSPETAITDYVAVARALAADVVGAGGTVRLGEEVESVEPGGAVTLRGGERVVGDRVLVCAGLQSDRLARRSGGQAAPRIIPFRGEYWALAPERTALVKGLIYPVPDPRLPFLGVHLTRRVDGAVLIGPNAVPATKLEGYRRRDFDGGDVRDILGWPGTRRMLGTHWRAGVGELARAASRRAFVRAARRYVPELGTADVIPAPAGVRAQAVDPDGALVDDFRLVGADGVTWVRNAPSPAATASLAIAEELVAEVGLA
ncbi:MAG: L-2-hydroxyglutarate oxidase [Actinobacteria bacterium]|nr:L-2-hydroxyglutarate oxidase [Actinomycetota bacterium]